MRLDGGSNANLLIGLKINLKNKNDIKSYFFKLISKDKAVFL